MAGSLKYHPYIDQFGEKWATFSDESNLEGITILPSSQPIDITPLNVAEYRYKLPQNIKPRRANYRSTTSVRVRNVILPTEEMYQDLATGSEQLASRTFTDPETGETFTLTGLSGEQFRPVVSEFDTGLNDGDDS